MRFVYAFFALICACLLCFGNYPSVSQEYHLLAISIIVAGALAGGD